MGAVYRRSHVIKLELRITFCRDLNKSLGRTVFVWAGSQMSQGNLKHACIKTMNLGAIFSVAPLAVKILRLVVFLEF